MSNDVYERLLEKCFPLLRSPRKFSVPAASQPPAKGILKKHPLVLKVRLNSANRSETQGQVFNEEDEAGSDEVEELVESGSDEVEELMESGSDEVEEPMEAGSDKVEELVEAGSDKVEELVEAGSDEVEELVEAGSDKVEELVEVGRNVEDSPTQFRCPICSMGFKFSMALKQHQRYGEVW